MSAGSLARAFGLSQDQTGPLFNAARVILEAGELTLRAQRLLEALRTALGLEVLPARSLAPESDLAAAFPQRSGGTINKNDSCLIKTPRRALSAVTWHESFRSDAEGQSTRMTRARTKAPEGQFLPRSTWHGSFPEASSRQVLADALVIAACVDEEVTLARELATARFADALEVPSGWVRLVGSLRRRSTFAIKRQLVRRSPDARRLFSRTWEEEGVLGVLRAVQFMAGLYRDAALAARFHALAQLETGSFGRTFHDHIQTRGLSFPGEKGGIPERMIHHDLMHVLNEYGTDPSGECEIAGFYAGFSGPEGFTFIMIALTTFQLGLAVSPAAVTPARGAFDPERVLAAFLRGRRLTVDVMGRWDYWSLLPLPLSEAREQLGLLSDTVHPA